MFLGKKIWIDGKLIDYDKAQIHVLTHALHYGTAVFEGIRSYNTDNGPAIFRLDDHIKRLYNSAKAISCILSTIEQKLNRLQSTWSNLII